MLYLSALRDALYRGGTTQIGYLYLLPSYCPTNSVRTLKEKQTCTSVVTKPWKWCKLMNCCFTGNCNTLHHQCAANSLPQCRQTLHTQTHTHGYTNNYPVHGGISCFLTRISMTDNWWLSTAESILRRTSNRLILPTNSNCLARTQELLRSHLVSTVWNKKTNRKKWKRDLFTKSAIYSVVGRIWGKGEGRMRLMNYPIPSPCLTAIFQVDLG